MPGARPHTLDVEDLALEVREQEDWKCMWELQVLVRRSEPFKASAIFACEASGGL